MAEYRVFTLGSDGHFIGVTDLVCDDDTQAVEKAKQLLDGHDLSIWSGSRYVGLLEHKDKSL
jgi:hypothetical protein